MTTTEVYLIAASAVTLLVAVSVTITMVIWRRRIAKQAEEYFKVITRLVANPEAASPVARRMPEQLVKKSQDSEGGSHSHPDAAMRTRTALNKPQPAGDFIPHRRNGYNGNGRCHDIEQLVGLVRKGDVASLAVARRELGKTIEEVAALVGVPAGTLSSWENGQENPVNSHLISWRLKLGDLVDERIAGYIGTDNKQLVTQFWEIMWRFSDLNSRQESPPATPPYP